MQCLVDVFPTLLFIKNAVQGTANILHDGQVDVRTEACLCTHRQMNIICILMFFCSYVFLFIALCSRWHCAVVEMRSLVLARDDAVGALCCCFVDVHILKTEEHKNKRGH